MPKLTILLISFLIAAVAIYFGIIRQPSTQNINVDGMYLAKPVDVTNFQLTDNHGKPFTKENLQGQWTMMFFGFTNCGMVCPLTMSALNKMYKILQTELPDNKLPQVVMVSVDPSRDSVKRMNAYVAAFNPHFIGARTGISETIAIEKQFHIAAAKMQVDSQGKDHYTINHSAEILLFNPRAQLTAFLSYPHKPEQMARDYQLILANTKM